MAQISGGGEDSKGMSYFFKLQDLNVTRNALICMLRLLPQFKLWILKKSNQNPPGQPGGGLPGEGNLKCVQILEPI